MVYVGDAKGRVFSWTVTDQPGKVVADHWMKDEGMDSCVACSVKFSFSERRHHCRNCGQLFCSKFVLFLTNKLLFLFILPQFCTPKSNFQQSIPIYHLHSVHDLS